MPNFIILFDIPSKPGAKDDLREHETLKALSEEVSEKRRVFFFFVSDSLTNNEVSNRPGFTFGDVLIKLISRNFKRSPLSFLPNSFFEKYEVPLSLLLRRKIFA